jgi:hypothetical protein
MHEPPSDNPFSVHGGRIYRGDAPTPGRTSLLRSGRNRRLGPSAAWRAGKSFYALLQRVVPRGAAFLTGVGAVAGCTCGALAFWDGVVHSPRLAVRELEVHDGTRRGVHPADRRFMEPAQILALADVPEGSPILWVDLEGVAQKIMRHPWVQRARVQRQLPGRLVIHVVEQRPCLLVSLKELYVANAAGELFKTFSAADKLNLPVVTGLQAAGAAANRLDIQDQVQQAVGLAAAISTHPMEISSLDELHWDQQVGWSAVVQTMVSSGGSLRLHLGKSPKNRLPVALSTLRFLMEKSQTPAVIWADGSKNAQRVQVRLVDSPALLSQRGSHGTEG